MHCPSHPSLIAGGDPTDCMYNGDVTLMADALQSFEGIITASGDLTITGDLPSQNLNLITLNSRNGLSTPTIIPTGSITTTGTTSLTLNANPTLTLNADPTVNTGNLNVDINIADLIVTTSMITSNAGDLILSTPTSFSPAPAMMFILLEGESLTVGSTLTAIDGTVFTISEDGNLIPNTSSTTGTSSTSEDLTADTNDPTSNNSSNTGAIVGGISGGVVLLTSIVYWLWPSDKAPLAQFQAFNADAYLPARQWIGMEHALTENIKFAVGSFWLSDGTVNTITPSMDNTGVDVRLSLAPRGFGEFSFSAAAYNYKDTDSQYKEDGTTTDLFLDNFQVSDERLEFGYALGLQWRASF